MNYRHLYYFWVVTKEGGFARAEEIFQIGQIIPDEVREAASSKVARLVVGLSDGISKRAAHRRRVRGQRAAGSSPRNAARR